MIRHLTAVWLTLLLPAVYAETLTIGFGSHKPPYVFENEARGLEYEIVVTALRQAGYEVKAIYAPMERLHRMLPQGTIDGITTTNPFSGIEAHYSQPYIDYRNEAAALRSRKLNIQRIEDLGRYSVSAFQRARQLLGPEFQAMANANPAYREEAQQIVRNRLLYSGRIDVVVGDRRIIEYFNGDVAGQVDPNQPLSWFPIFPPTHYSVAFRDAAVRERFDRALDALRKSGAYAAIERRYAAPMAEPPR
ncbi:ABC transporter substrate-binding protein [Chitinimonas sp. BJYL2]|uniref:substrate-binding periplasmic protein n=1 Tax=Chitinimonas sp. BJYL2 TaxID=2976696 RepID=UPI0022B2D2C4|nr:transporter substrate-binding domain-containing protein [Chitinimonas sp. BJYL2]